MSNIERRIERRSWNLCYEGKVFLIGAVTGALLLTVWNYIYKVQHLSFGLSEDTLISQLKVDSDHMLVNYIDGRWESSIKDLVLTIEIDSRTGTILVEAVGDLPRRFKIVKINDVNGVLGILTLDLCLEGHEDDIISIQINKVFGVDKAITVTYDGKFAKCSEAGEDKCVKGFRRH